MSDPTAPSDAQSGDQQTAGSTSVDGLPPVADIYADVDPSVPRTDTTDEPRDAGLGC